MRLTKLRSEVVRGAQLKLVEELRKVEILAIPVFIIDLDGVITDTAEYHYRACKSLADAERISFAREDNDALRGVSRRKSLTGLLKDREITASAAEEWLARKNGYYLVYIEQPAPED